MTRVRRCPNPQCKTEIAANGGADDCTTCRLLARRRDKLKAAKARNKPDMDKRGFEERPIIRNPLAYFHR